MKEPRLLIILSVAHPEQDVERLFPLLGEYRALLVCPANVEVDPIPALWTPWSCLSLSSPRDYLETRNLERTFTQTRTPMSYDAVIHTRPELDSVYQIALTNRVMGKKNHVKVPFYTVFWDSPTASGVLGSIHSTRFMSSPVNRSLLQTLSASAFMDARDNSHNVGQLPEIIDEEYGWANKALGPSMRALFVEAIEQVPSPFTAEQFYAALTRVSTSDRAWGKVGDPVSRMWIRSSLLGMGLKDIGEGLQEVYQ